MQEYRWPQPVRREDGRICETADEYFGGPFFDSTGRFLYENLLPNPNLADTVSSLEGEEKESFLDLARGMLVWRQDVRRSAGELAGHPFLQLKQTNA
ncbi:hypothetical protein BJY04DRAFT_213478 [Aspergillus karnatakaensis]|uniref:putative protein kinase n=1 Tax=Aspergillus karnatakaensis TaxID=1810916 RepID=UPI003CCDE3FC